MSKYDSMSIEEALESNSQLVFNVALKFMGNVHDASDIAQDSLLKAYQNRHKFNQKSKFSTWICAITINSCKDALRKQNKLPEFTPIYEEQISTGSDPLAEFEKSELLQELRRAINYLCPEHKEIIIYKEYLGLSYEDIAKQENLAVGTVKSRLSRAKQALRQIMSERMMK